jgi:hypothetical protein
MRPPTGWTYGDSRPGGSAAAECYESPSAEVDTSAPVGLVVEWAGHSLAVLVHAYATCVDGDEVMARKRIEAALTLDAA